ncbi:MAG: hypothetical protein ACW964_05770 [Candidatus Hodarchaeales archaeon]|jgi:hypothetical protein
MSMEELLTPENYPELLAPWDTPCLICDHLEKCNLEFSEFNPISCPWMNLYLSKGKTD